MGQTSQSRATERSRGLCYHATDYPASPVCYGEFLKSIGVFGTKRENLHTGTVFDAERRGMSHLAEKIHGPLKKCIFLKNFQEKLR